MHCITLHYIPLFSTLIFDSRKRFMTMMINQLPATPSYHDQNGNSQYQNLSLTWKLESLLKKDESAFEFIKKSYVSYHVTSLPFLDTLSRRKEGLASGSLVCFEGGAGSGKSEVLLQAIANCALPVEFGGNGSSVQFFSIDSKFNINRLATLLRFRILSSSSSSFTERFRNEPNLLRKFIGDSLSRVTVYYPENTSALIMLLHRFLYEQENINIVSNNGDNSNYYDSSISVEERCKTKRPTSLLVIDGIGTKYYPNKVFEELHPNNIQSSYSSSSSYNISNVLSNLTKILKQIITQESLSILVGQQAIFSSNGNRSANYMSRVYSSMNAITISLEKCLNSFEPQASCHVASVPNGNTYKFSIQNDGIKF